MLIYFKRIAPLEKLKYILKRDFIVLLYFGHLSRYALRINEKNITFSDSVLHLEYGISAAYYWDFSCILAMLVIILN